MGLEMARMPLTGFWGPGVRSQGEKGQTCRTEEGGDGARPWDSGHQQCELL